LPERVVDGEERWQALGIVDGVTLLVVIHTYRDDHGDEIVRIIGARRAMKHERRSYEEDT
jgi:uncharacterized DUF497 family protein